MVNLSWLIANVIESKVKHLGDKPLTMMLGIMQVRLASRQVYKELPRLDELRWKTCPQWASPFHGLES